MWEEDDLKLYPGIIRFLTRWKCRGNNLILLLCRLPTSNRDKGCKFFTRLSFGGGDKQSWGVYS